jgi:hypothetical protein
MTEDPIQRALAELPRLQAGPGFTDEVLARAAAPAPGRGRLAPVGIVACFLLAGGLAAAFPAWHQARLRGEQRARVEALQREHRELERELRALRRLAAEHSPVVYLGGDESVDLVLDLDSLAGAVPASGARPAGYSVQP